MISSSPFNFRIIRARVAQAIKVDRLCSTTNQKKYQRQTHDTHKTHKDDSDLQAKFTRQPVMRLGPPPPPPQYHVPFSGGNWPPGWTKFLKDDAARLKAPCGSVRDLDMSDRWVTSRDDMLLSSRWWRWIRDCNCERGLYTGANVNERRPGRKPLNHWGVAMTKWQRGAQYCPVYALC
jgi:hypothetical protein